MLKHQPIHDDGEVRGLTATDFAMLRPIAEVDPTMTDAVLAHKRRGRPPAVSPKRHIGFRFAAEVVDGIKASGRGYNARVERVLRDALGKGEI